jgi:2-oxoglutarate dehydrogenase E1 component
MSRQPKNEAFARTSFLHGANAAYIEEMQAQYQRNPGSVSDEWRHFFASLQEERRGGNGPNGDHGRPSWARPLEQAAAEGDRELIGALTGDYGEVEQKIRGELQARAAAGGFDLSPAASLRATQDSIRALMLIRAYRAMGHLAADLDPLGLAVRK